MKDRDISEYKLIQFRSVQKMEVDGEWPKYTMMSLKLLREDSACKIDSDGHVLITVDNGWAKYKLDTTQRGDYDALCLELVESGK